MTEHNEQPRISIEEWLRFIQSLECRRQIASDREVLTGGLRMRQFLSPFINLTEGFNCIPGDPGDKCFGLLIVFVGTEDNLELHLEKAVNHVAVSCSGTTEHVIIYAAQWNSGTWIGIKRKFEKLRQQFPRLTVVLKIVGLGPQVLIPQ